MTDDPIDLDNRRTLVGLGEVEFRRRSANEPSRPAGPQEPDVDVPDDSGVAEPERTWIEVMESWRFLLDRYAETPEARHDEIQECIRRAIEDMERLIKREERE